MKKTGLVGWRGMVGSVLMERMRAENDFEHIEPIFFTTSQAGRAAPVIGGSTSVLQDAFDIDALSKTDIILTCQGGDYTNRVYTLSYETKAGRVTGLMPPQRCAQNLTR